MGLLPGRGRAVTCARRSRSGAASHQACANAADGRSRRPGETNPAPGCAAPVPGCPPSVRPSCPSHCLCFCRPDKPEILRASARYQEAEGAGLLLVLFVLVQANPPASITWVDQDGRVMANASEFLLLGTAGYPGLANHSLRVRLGSAAGNFSVSAANSVGVTTASLLPPGRCRGGGGEGERARSSGPAEGC